MSENLDQMALISGLFGGLALFLFGLEILTRALRMVAGNSMRDLLARMTRNRVTGLFAGAAVTAIIQSSSVTTVLVVGFISAGLMTTAQSVAVIFGANIGTTITAQILAFHVTALALPALALGFFVAFASPDQRVQEYGRIVLGLGMVFFGMAVMGDAVAPLRAYPPFLTFMHSLDNVALAALVGAGFTALVQSSSATTGILIVMAAQGLLALEPAIALAMGANVGTCVTALLASIGKPRAAVRAALIHVLFNVTGVMIWIGFIDQLADLARVVTPGHDGDIPRQLANVHTVFNVANALAFLGLTGHIARLSERVLPDRAEPAPPAGARFLDPSLMTVPAIALDAARREVLHLGTMTRAQVEAALPAVLAGSPLDLDRLHVADRPIDLLHREIVAYMRQLGSGALSEAEAGQMMLLLGIANDLEHIGDLVATGLVTSARKRMEENVAITQGTAAVISGLHGHVLAALDGALRALDQKDAAAAQEVRQMKDRFTALQEAFSAHELIRLRSDAPRRLQTYAREIELTEVFDDIFRNVRRISQAEISLFGKPGELAP